jgi:hypothetical protein
VERGVGGRALEIPEPGEVSGAGAGIAGGGRGPREDAGGEAAGTS